MEVSDTEKRIVAQLESESAGNDRLKSLIPRVVVVKKRLQTCREALIRFEKLQTRFSDFDLDRLAQRPAAVTQLLRKSLGSGWIFPNPDVRLVRAPPSSSSTPKAFRSMRADDRELDPASVISIKVSRLTSDLGPEDIALGLFHTLEWSLRACPDSLRDGFVFMINMEGAAIQIVEKLIRQQMLGKLCSIFAHDSYPIKVRGIFIYHCSNVSSLAVRVIKSYLSQKVRDRVKIIKTAELQQVVVGDLEGVGILPEHLITESPTRWCPRPSAPLGFTEKRHNATENQGEGSDFTSKQSSPQSTLFHRTDGVKRVILSEVTPNVKQSGKPIATPCHPSGNEHNSSPQDLIMDEMSGSPEVPNYETNELGLSPEEAKRNAETRKIFKNLLREGFLDSPRAFVSPNGQRLSTESCEDTLSPQTPFDLTQKLEAQKKKSASILADSRYRMIDLNLNKLSVSQLERIQMAQQRLEEETATLSSELNEDIIFREEFIPLECSSVAEPVLEEHPDVYAVHREGDTLQVADF